MEVQDEVMDVQDSSLGKWKLEFHL